jgi:hypothetical protein
MNFEDKSGSCSHFFGNLIAESSLIRAFMAKIPQSLWRAGLFASVLMASVCITKAASPTPPPAGAGSPDEKSIVSNSSSMPSPDLLFDKLDAAFPNFDWKTVVEKEVNDPNFQKTDYADSVAKISNLGVRLAAAFIAVQAKDYDALQKAAAVSVELTKSFSAAGKIKSYADEADQQAKAGDWLAVKETIRKIASEVGKELKSNGSRKEEATMAMATGWLAGVHLVTDALASQYSADGAKIVREGPLAALVVAQLKSLTTGVQQKNGGKKEDSTHSSLQKITEGVTQIAELITKDQTKPLTKEEVNTIRDQSAGIIKQIEA